MMSLKRHMNHPDNNIAECVEATQPVLKRLRLSSSEPDMAQLTDCQPDHQASRLADPAAGSPAPAHLQHAQDPTNYAAMNALLKQLHLEWLQRHPGTHHDDAALNLAG